MRFIRFNIENFKGIEKTVLDFSKIPNANIFTLVGLNESGKTTILEAINSFSPDVEGVEILYRDVIRKGRVEDLVPKAKKANFNGQIKVIATLELDDADRSKIEGFCKETLNCKIDLTLFSEPFSIERLIEFKDSVYVRTVTAWPWLSLKIGKSRTFKECGSDTEEWKAIVKFMGGMIPKICYFPTFLFGFPDRIYLSNPPKEKDTQVNAYFVQIVQDILDSLSGGFNIQKHILDRVERTVKPDTAWNLFGFFKTDEKQQIDHVMLKIAERVTDVVFKRWNDVFGIKIQNKTIDVDWDIEIDPNDAQKRAVYLKFWIRDGVSKFEIAERSLGFRWFFCFLLFTQFRVSRRDSSAVFLFDEPASNLHARAQEQLLKSFPNISKGDNMIVYSTHSHYMINPHWLEGTFIVFNDAIDYDDNPVDESKPKTVETAIHVKKYRDFVGQNPSKITYFQPILDKLDYAPSKLEVGQNAIFVEGKNDFYMLAYFNQVLLDGKHNIRVIPSSSANQLGPLISLYLGWGKKFLALLDDDKAGRNARDSYIREWFLTSSEATTIGDMLPQVKNRAIEKLLSPSDRKLIASELQKQVATKKDIGRFFQERLAQGMPTAFDAQTIAAIDTLLGECAKKIC
jgi:predicted ATPase